MTCPGLHCPGCTGGQSLGILGGAVVGLVLAAATVQWVAEHIWWIGGTLAVCFTLATAASMWLEAWSDRRGASFAAAHGILSRADLILPPPARAIVIQPAPGQLLPAAAPVTVNIFGVPSAEAAAIIRQAIPGPAGDAITEGNHRG